MSEQNLSRRELLERVRRARELQPAVRREVKKRLEALSRSQRRTVVDLRIRRS